MIADNAYRLFTEELTFRRSIAKIMDKASKALEKSIKGDSDPIEQ